MTWSAPRPRTRSALAGAAHGRDLGAEVLGQLHGHGAHRPRGAVDQHRVTGRKLAQPEEVEGRHPTEAHRHGVLISEALGDRGDRSVLGHRRSLGMAPEVEPARQDHPVTRPEPRDRAAHRLDLSRHVEAEDGLLRFGEAELQPHRQAHSPRYSQRPHSGVAGVDGRHRTLDQHLVVGRHGGRDLADLHDLGRSVAFADCSLHAPPRPVMDRRTVARACGMKTAVAGVAPRTVYLGHRPGSLVEARQVRR